MSKKVTVKFSTNPIVSSWHEVTYVTIAGFDPAVKNSVTSPSALAEDLRKAGGKANERAALLIDRAGQMLGDLPGLRRYRTANGAIPPGTFVFAIDSLSARHGDLVVFCHYLKSMTESKY